MRAFGVSPGKVILVGEHFVVGEAPAIVAAVKLFSTVIVNPDSNSWTTIASRSLNHIVRFKGEKSRAVKGGKNAIATLRPIHSLSEAAARHAGVKEQGMSIEIESEIPVGVGLGSSASIAVSTIAAILKLFQARIGRETIRELAYQSETMIHGAPSGIDQTIVTYGGVISYARGRPFTRVKPRRALSLVIGNTGKVRSTGTMVTKVQERLNKSQVCRSQIMEAATSISARATRALQSANLQQLGNLMNLNQNLLQMVGASTVELDSLILAARRAGALGAKLTGAGGGGCMVALAQRGKEQQIADAITRAGGIAYEAAIDERGVRAWLSK